MSNTIFICAVVEIRMKAGGRKHVYLLMAGEKGEEKRDLERVKPSPFHSSLTTRPLTFPSLRLRYLTLLSGKSEVGERAKLVNSSSSHASRSTVANLVSFAHASRHP
jgi:hypothetical protein